MPSRESQIMMGVLRTMGPVFARLPRDKKRAGMDLLGHIKRPPHDMLFKADAKSPVPAEWLIPAEATEDQALLYIHGGSYETGSLKSNRALSSLAAQASGVRAFSFEYRLAPEHPYPAALEDTLAAYRYLLASGFAPHNIALFGESAGGGLCLALCLHLRDAGEALPASIVALSPWTDLTNSSSSHLSRAQDDPLLTTDDLRVSALNYAGGEDVKNSAISPLFGEFHGFPPVLLQVGTHEILMSDSVSLAQKMKEAGVLVTLAVFEEMWHVWQAYDVPESREAMGQAGAFLRAHFPFAAPAGEDPAPGRIDPS